MNLFGRRQVPVPGTEARLARLESEMERLSSALRTLETEQITMHDRVQKWMRRAVAAERRADESREPIPEAADPGRIEAGAVSAATPARPRLTMWGARRRMAERNALRLAGLLPAEPSAENTENGNGLHP